VIRLAVIEETTDRQVGSGRGYRRIRHDPAPPNRGHRADLVDEDHAPTRSPRGAVTLSLALITDLQDLAIDLAAGSYSRTTLEMLQRDLRSSVATALGASITVPGTRVRGAALQLNLVSQTVDPQEIATGLRLPLDRFCTTAANVITFYATAPGPSYSSPPISPPSCSCHQATSTSTRRYRSDHSTRASAACRTWPWLTRPSASSWDAARVWTRLEPSCVAAPRRPAPACSRRPTPFETRTADRPAPPRRRPPPRRGSTGTPDLDDHWPCYPPAGPRHTFRSTAIKPNSDRRGAAEPRGGFRPG